VDRRSFVALLAVSPWLRGEAFDLAAWERKRVLDAATRYLKEQPITITAARSDRSAGGLHDFFSEGDYWWPDPKNPDGPYIQRDGETNPGNFVEHRRYMMRFSVQMPALAAAWKITGDEQYARHAVRHLRAWFIEPATRMNPHLLYAQAIKGRFTGRGIGIIDTIHLVEVARAAAVLEGSKSFRAAEVKQWFAEYLKWMTTHAYGIAERDATNNHGVCWVMQAAEFARLTANAEMTAWCVERFKTVLVPNHMTADGSFPRELARTKPYGYSLFVLDAITAVAQILDLWNFTLPDGRGMARAVAYLYPYILDKKKWPKPPDVMYFDEWPMRHHLLLFAGLALDKPEYLDLWKRLPADSAVDEVIRNFFIRQPVLWVK